MADSQGEGSAAEKMTTAEIKAMLETERRERAAKFHEALRSLCQTYRCEVCARVDATVGDDGLTRHGATLEVRALD